MRRIKGEISKPNFANSVGVDLLFYDEETVQSTHVENMDEINGKLDENYYYFLGDENPTNSDPKQYIYAVNINDLTLEWKTETGKGFVPSSDTAGIEMDDLFLYTTDLNGKITCVSKRNRNIGGNCV